MGTPDTGLRIAEFVVKTFGRGALVALVIGAVLGLSIGGFYGFDFGKSQNQARLDLANQRAVTAETMNADANKRASEAKEQKAKLEEEISSLRTQLQGYQKKSAALQKQPAKRPKNPIVSDLYTEDDFIIMGYNRRFRVMGRYMLVASPRGLLGNDGCTVTVGNVDNDREDKFEFVEGKSTSVAVGEATVSLILVSLSFGQRSNVCVFQERL